VCNLVKVLNPPRRPVRIFGTPESLNGAHRNYGMGYYATHSCQNGLFVKVYARLLYVPSSDVLFPAASRDETLELPDPSRVPHPTLSTTMCSSIFARNLCTWTYLVSSILGIVSTDKFWHVLPDSSI